MKVTAKLFESKQEGSVKAFGSITLEGCFVVQIKVVESKNGAFVSFPNYKTQNGDYKDQAFPITKEFRQEIIDVVMAEYEKFEGKEQPTKQEEPESDFPFWLGGNGWTKDII